jgi:uncharacterized protein with von Willebrand factor type A (vWA) domain
MTNWDRKGRSRKLVGGKRWFGQSPVGESKKYDSVSDQKKKDEIKLRNEIRELEGKIDNEEKDKKKALTAIDDAMSKMKKDLDQKKANLDKLTSWFGGKSRRSRRTYKK